MSKKYLEILNLADNATDEMIGAAIQKLADDKQQADNKVLELADKLIASEGVATGYKAKLDAIELADKTAKKQAFKLELADCFKDGRLSEKADGSVKTKMLELYDANPEATMDMLTNLPKRKSVAVSLGDKTGEDGESKWAQRQREIEENSKKK